MALTSKEVQFMKSLKDKGVSKQDAIGRLSAVRVKLGTTAPSIQAEETVVTPKVATTETIEVAPRKSEQIFSTAKEQISSVPELIKTGKGEQAAVETVKAGVSAIGGLAKAGSEKLVELSGRLGTGLGLKIEQLRGNITPEQAKQTYTEIVTDPEFFTQDEQTRADIVNAAATFLIPSAGVLKASKATTLAGKVGGGVIAGVEGITAAKVLTEGEIPSLREAAIGAATGAALPLVGQTLKKAGSKIFKSAFAATAREADMLQDFKVGRLKKEPRTAAKTALEKGLKGTEKSIGIQAGKTADKLKTEVKTLLSNSKEVITKDELLIPVLDDIAKIPEGTRRQQLLKGFEAFMDANKDLSDEVSLEDAQSLKRELAKFLPNKAFKGEEIGGALSEVKNKLAKNIRTLTYNKLVDEGAKQKYLDWSNLIQLENLSKKAFQRTGFQGGSGKLVSTLYNLGMVPIQTIGGQTLYNVGDLITIQGPANLTKLGELLDNDGVTQDDLKTILGD